jgi:hypothetical protein
VETAGSVMGSFVAAQFEVSGCPLRSKYSTG